MPPSDPLPREPTASASSEVRNIAYWAAKNDVERILAEVPILPSAFRLALGTAFNRFAPCDAAIRWWLQAAKGGKVDEEKNEDGQT